MGSGSSIQGALSLALKHSSSDDQPPASPTSNAGGAVYDDTPQKISGGNGDLEGASPKARERKQPSTKPSSKPATEDGEKLVKEEIMLLAARSATLNTADIPVIGDVPPCEYLKRQRLGRGAFAETYLAERTSDGQLCAAKFVDLSNMGVRDRTYAFSEIGCLASCEHFGVIGHCKSAICDGKVLVIIMEFADGGTLQKAIHEHNFTEKEIGMIFLQLMCSVNYIHSKRMIHRDIKSANILLTSTGLAKMGDFGFSQRYDESVSNEVAQSFLGTPYYLAPELWLKRRYGKRADVWACGIVLYEMLTRNRPFTAQNMKELGDKIIAGDYEIPETISLEMKVLLKTVLCVKPEERPSAKAILRMPIMARYLHEFRTSIAHSQLISEEERARIFAQLTDMEQTLCIGEPTACTFEGPVFKMSGGHWKSRYLILADGFLTLTLPAGRMAGGSQKERSKKIPTSVLTSVVPLPPTTVNTTEIHVFAINTELKSVIVLGTSSLSERDTWVQVLLVALGMGTPGDA